MPEQTEKKEFFTSRCVMILAVIGIAVGTGNIWRFSRIVAQNGGGSSAMAPSSASRWKVNLPETGASSCPAQRALK